MAGCSVGRQGEAVLWKEEGTVIDEGGGGERGGGGGFVVAVVDIATMVVELQMRWMLE